MSAIELYDYQRRWFLNKSRFKVGMFARQTGKTFTTTLEIVDDVMEAEALGRRSRWVILSRGERQAKEAINEGVKVHMQAYGLACEAMESEFKADKVSYAALEITTPKGSKITALPANPDTARGFSANVFLDEFAFHRDSKEIWRALFPVISKPGLKLRVVSTPNGKGNKFYELMTSQEYKIWYRQTTDIYQAVADGLPRDIEELKSGLGDVDSWAQEYELQWLDEASSWLPYDLINSVEHESAGEPDLYAGGVCFVGVDISARNDLFVIWVLEQVGDVCWTREIIAKKGISFAEQDALLDRVMRKYRVIRVCIDQTGMGEKPVEDAKRRYGSLRVEGVLFNMATKLALATTGKESFQDKRIRIPRGDRSLRDDLHKLKRVASATGAPRFLADSDSDGHADRTWACFLALNAAITPTFTIEFESIGKRECSKAGMADFNGG